MKKTIQFDQISAKNYLPYLELGVLLPTDKFFFNEENIWVQSNYFT